MPAISTSTDRRPGFARLWLVALVVSLLGLTPLGGATRASATTGNPGGVSIDAGGSGDGASFSADQYYTGGGTAGNNGLTGNPNAPLTVAHPIPVADWNTYRYLDTTYAIPSLVPGAAYQVRLYFLDWYWSQVGKRVFNVSINGSPVLQNFDIVQASVNAGGDGTYQGVEKDFTATADTSGTVTIAFSRGSADQAMVNAISLVSLNSGGVGVDAGGPGDGASFGADQYYTGGGTAGDNGVTGNPNWPGAVSHPIPVSDWNTYRYLDTTYQIPALTPGAGYQVRLYFLDWYWTKVGKRAFNVSINGSPVLQNFDIVQAAVNAGGDGSYLGVEKDFTATADANGTITIAFGRGSVDQAMVNAIDVVPSS